MVGSMSENEILRLVKLRELAASGEAQRIREAARLTQGEVADVVGVHKATISRWESGGSRIPRGRTADRYADLLEKLTQQVPA